jgi:coenzyme PQQ precursor peptide PqqA
MCRGPPCLEAGTNAGCTGEAMMAWKTPKIVEISLAMEINCYACADIA